MAPRPNPLHLYGDHSFDVSGRSACLEHAGAYVPGACGECSHRRLSQAVSLEYIDFQMGFSDGKAQPSRDGSDPEEIILNFIEEGTREHLRAEWPFDTEAVTEYIDFQMGMHHTQEAVGFDAEEIPFAIADRPEADDRVWLQKEPSWICPQEIVFADCVDCFESLREHTI